MKKIILIKDLIDKSKPTFSNIVTLHLAVANLNLSEVFERCYHG